MKETMEPSFSILVMSVASSAAIAMGITPNPQTGKTELDKTMAKFNIDLLEVLRDKTIGNLTEDEQRLVESILSDLQMKFINLK